MESQGLIRIVRQSESDIKMRLIECFVDEKHVGDVLYGQTLEIPVPPGEHDLKATNRLKSTSQHFSVSPGEVVEFRVTAVMMGGLWMLVSLLGTVAYRIR